jgi:hypothetical protein
LTYELTGIDRAAIIYEDNLGTLFLVKNSQLSARAKHIDARNHFYAIVTSKQEDRCKIQETKEKTLRHYDKEYDNIYP